jgi:hypothetical protein
MPDKTFENILNPEILNLNLKIISMFIAIYESFKEAIVENVKDFYCTGFSEGKLIYSHEYEQKVLGKIESKENRQIRATILWFFDHDAINESDMKKFIEITDERNRLTHDMFNVLSVGLTTRTLDLLLDMLKLYEKMEKWWIVNIEIPADLDLLVGLDKVDINSTMSLKVEFLKIMTEAVLTDTKKYYEIYKN